MVPRLPSPSALASTAIHIVGTVLVVPVRVLRGVADVAARTARQWEVALTVATAPPDALEPHDADTPDDDAASATAGSRSEQAPSRMGQDTEAVPSGDAGGTGTVEPETVEPETVEPEIVEPERDEAPSVDLRETPPVEDWAQLSLADAQARSASCSPAELAALLAYEQQHGRRIPFELMLRQRLRHEVG